MSENLVNNLVTCKPLWNIVSVACPIVAGALFVLLRPTQGSPIIGDLGVFIFAGAYATPVGFVAAVVALVRKERFVWLSLAGILVNLPLALLLIVFLHPE